MKKHPPPPCPPKRTYNQPTSKFIGLLEKIISKPKECVLTAGLTKYGKDRSIFSGCTPAVVVKPSSTVEVAEVVKLCSEHTIPITTRGAGSGLEGGAIPLEKGVVLSTENLRKIEVDPVNMYVDVGAGVYKNELNKYLKKKYGLIFGPDPASNPSLGGMVSTSGSGLSTIRYGTTRENVISLVVVTPQGKIVRTRQKVRKASTGYELTQLYIGAEGTLGVVTEICARVFPLQRKRAGVVSVLPSLRSACEAVVSILKLPRGSLARCELLNAEMIEATNACYGTTLDCDPTLFLEFQSNNIEVIRREWERIKQELMKFGVRGTQYSEKEKEIDKIWGARRGCYWSVVKYRKLTMNKKKIDKNYSTDVCVPVSHLAQCVAETEEDFKKINLPCLICAHIADGNFHCNVPYQDDEKGLFKDAEKRLIQRTVRFGGAVSGEHGVGIGKRDHICLEHGETHINLQRSIKKALDPKFIMNPHKIFVMDDDNETKESIQSSL
eukprot:jgi/Bigna1/56451/estExt_Genewise1Plus.C_990019